MSTPRKPRRTTPAKAVGNALTAAARRIRPRSVKRSNQYGDWSDESWYFFSEVGELHYLATTVANAMSMVELYIAKRDVQGGWLRIDDDNDPAVIALDALAGDSPTGMAEMLRRFGLNLFVAGDCYLVGHPPEDPTGMPPELGYIDPALPQQPQGLDLATLCWKVYSAAEVRFDAGKVKVAGRDFPEDDVIAVRVWRPHPRNMNFADAPVRSALPILRELVALTKYVSAVLDSRFAGAGIVWMPEGAEMLGAGAPEDEADSDPFLERIMDAMIEPIKNRDAASSVVPIFVTLPDDTAFQPNYMSFAGTLDGTAKELRDEAIRRLALSLDAPPEVLTGMGSTSHWSAWLVAEDMIKLHVLPPIGLVRDALVREYLRPILEANGVANPEDYTIEADASALTLRPNRSTEAMALYDKGLITDASAREALGFGEEDAPDLPAAVDEAVSRAMDMVAQAPHLLVPVSLPELVAQIREVMGGPKAPEVAIPPIAAPAPANPTPVVEPGPAQSPQPGQGAAA